MKELSTEEKAKARNNGDDEKIRQFLIHEVTETSDEIMSYRNMNKKDILAWLEKQGEQKQVIDYSDSLPKDNWELIHEFVNKFERIPKDEDELNVLIEYVLKRHKSAWSEEDERIYQSIMDDTVQENQLDDKQTNWLKSLKERYTWRPSDEQLKKRRQ